MLQLGTCSSCRGFLGISVVACPHCGLALGRARRLAAGATALLGGGAVSMTLMACYGGACINDDCSGTAYGEADSGRRLADARVDDGANDGGSGDASQTDASADAASDVLDAAPSDATADGPVDAPAGG